MQLRDYQERAVRAIREDFATPGNSVIVLPTGSGKSVTIASAVSSLATRALVLCPNREILAQNKDKLSRYVPEHDIGVYSASFGTKDIRKFTLATINSIYKTPELFSGIPLVIVDECHLVAVKKEMSMYTSFFSAIGNPKVYGFTATPYRLEQGYNIQRNNKGGYDQVASTMLKLINRMRHKKATEMFWKRIIFNMNHGELVDAGHIMPITYIENPLVEYKEIPVNKSRSDYDIEAYADMIVGQEANAVQVIIEAQQKHASVLVFCASLDQAWRLSSVVDGSEVVAGDTPTRERERIIEGFKAGTIRTVFNCQVLTTGFDHPRLDCVVLLRPTRSPLLYNQMVGRLVRKHTDKHEAVLYDLSDTVRALGKVESFELYKDARGLWDLRTERHQTWNNRVLFSMKV